LSYIKSSELEVGGVDAFYARGAISNGASSYNKLRWDEIRELGTSIDTLKSATREGSHVGRLVKSLGS